MSHTRNRVFIAGYSRGGAAAINASKLLNESKISVDCLLLFDAVDMTVGLDAQYIPNNVKYCFHATRHPATRSRSSWGNCGTQYDTSKTKYTNKMFFCTHGAMGGMPWKSGNSKGFIEEIDEDLPSARTVAVLSGSAALVVYTTSYIYHAASKTNVTVTMDRLGSQKVGAWMDSALQTQKSNHIS